MPSHPHQSLLDSLDSITGTGVFCATGGTPFFMPELHVEGVGEVAFPLTRSQTRELIAAAEAAPYGKGMATVRDEKVRKCWQLDAQKFSLRSDQWGRYLEQTVHSAAVAMGVEGKVAAEPYKLLLYEKGGHFLPHRDTEKLSAMFGTLIIALPSAHEGGRLLVRHGGAEVAVDFSGPEGLRQFQSAALFADCEHEVEPVTAGVRCCLVYNLVLEKGKADALNRPLNEHARRLMPLLRGMKWPAPAKPAAILLEHHYTEANFSLQHLKGHDAARARALLAAAVEAGLVAHLALKWDDGGDAEEEKDQAREPFALTLAVIAGTGEHRALETVLSTVTPAAFACLDGALWKSLMRAFGAAPFARISAALRKEEATQYRTPLFLMLDAASTCGESAVAADLARHLSALPPLPAPSSWGDAIGEAVPGSEPELLIMLRASAHLTAAEHLAGVLTFLKSGGSLPSVRQHLAPALLKWSAGTVKPVPDTPPAAALAHAIALLAAEIARPIMPYPDLARPCPVPEPSAVSWRDRESAPLLAELRAFMANPAAATHIFARRQSERDVIENLIRHHRLDLDTTTIRKGSPHQLHCIKNSASHHRALKLREADIALLRKLKAI